MIGQLRGRLEDKRPNQVLMDVAGVGYQVQIPLSTFAALGELHSEVTLLIHTHLREDQIALFGFLTAREKHLFELLLSASGVGPNLALRILSGMSVDDLVPAIRAGDLAKLTGIPGIGRKTAERIVVELRDRLAALEATPAEVGKASRASVEDDVASALANLGYDRREIARALDAVRREGRAAAGFELLLRAALGRLSAASTKAGHAGPAED
jgi:Holliday junction DNA helicase RuvA